MSHARILIVDDDEILQDLLAMHLEVAGYVVLTAPDGQAGLDALRGTGADLVLLDLMMPVMDGLRFMRGLKELAAAPPVIVLSAAGHGQREAEARAAGAHTVIRKPIEADALIRSVRSALGAKA